MTPLRLLDLFSGIGGFSLGLERSGAFKTVAFCEIEPFPRKVLRKHWPDVPIYDDVRTLTAERLAADGITVDAIFGGFPCQDISYAGKGAGLDGKRSGLWFEYARIVGELAPLVIVVENVRALLSRGLDAVLGTLASLGYDAVWDDISAEDIGAPHPRSRIWIVAYARRARLEGQRLAIRIQKEIANARRSNDVANSSFIARLLRMGKRGLGSVVNGEHDRPAWAGQQWPKTEPLLYRVDDGIPNRVDRTSALGNAVVPQVVEAIGRAIAASMEATQ